MKREVTRVHWLWPRLCPELTLFSSAVEARAALLRANAEYFRRARLWLIIATLIGVSILIGIFLPMCVASRIGVYLTIGLWNLIPAAVTLYLIRRQMRCSLRRQLLEHGVPVCMNCGYPLRGLASGRCPECGTSTPLPSREPQ